uniref:Uncharacterized protein n=1 Tax=Tanacetum cinerariifolium TaxID=118510 RepID=A0A6L2K507_TANCI|nr:hypothetical protein [Tanacetum cinerariifolium]
MEMSESEDISIEIPEVYNTDDIVQEWDESTKGINTMQRNESKRIEKLPDLLLKSEKGRRNREYYKPMVVSFGPYHHRQKDLARAEKYKRVTLKDFCSSVGKTKIFVYNKVFEVVHEAKKCYIDGSTILHVLLELMFPNEAEVMLKRFFNYLNTRDPLMKNEKSLDMKQSIHLLELYRSYFIYLDPSSHRSVVDINYALRKRLFASVMDLKDKGIVVKCNHKESSSKADMKFHSHSCTGSEDRSTAIAAYVRTLEVHVTALIAQTSSLQTQLTTALGRIETYYTIWPLPDDSSQEIIKLLKQIAYHKPSSTHP